MTEESTRVARTAEELRGMLDERRTSGARIGFVPTMGALHEGHLSLVRGAARECGLGVVSIFVNPTQFEPGEDFDRYPRDREGDRRKLGEAGAGLVFLPETETLYPPGSSTFVHVERLSRLLCGATREGHFRGVATVVWKLLEIVSPHVAYFGAKDAQQVVVIRRMVRDLFGPWEIRSLPTVREKDGLAMSSRNAYLSAEERAAAPALYRALSAARARAEDGERRAERIVAAARGELEKERRIDPEYLTLVSLADLQPVEQAEGDLLLAAAARLGAARLIDNICLRVGAEVEEILP